VSHRQAENHPLGPNQVHLSACHARVKNPESFVGVSQGRFFFSASRSINQSLADYRACLTYCEDEPGQQFADSMYAQRGQ